MNSENCSPDGGTLFGVILLGFFIASTAGLFSKDKETRNNALKAGFVISIGGTLAALRLSC